MHVFSGKHLEMPIAMPARRFLAASCLGLGSLSIQKILAESSDKTNLALEPLSHTFFPTEWSVGPSEPQRLVGMGVRSVTFLQFHAYSMGFYVANSAIEQLKTSSRWIQEFSPSKWRGSNSESRNFYVKNLIHGNEMCLMICPVRPTDGVHLRNGFVKLLQTKFEKESKSLDEEKRREVSKAIEDFKALFPSKAIPKGIRLVFSRQKDGSLNCFLSETLVGKIDNALLSEWFFEEYLLGDEISPSLVRSVGIGLYDLIKPHH